MERLTNRTELGVSIDKNEDCPTCSICWNCDIPPRKCNYINDALEKLAEYEDLEEQGRLIKLPCKVGDTVYVPTRDFVSELRIAHITISKNNIFFHWMLNAGIYPNLDGFSSSKIGEMVFFAKSEAEAKLKELRGEENE